MALTHFDAAGRAAMVDVAGKPETDRVAVARGRIVMAPETLALIEEGRPAKGEVLAGARLAALLAPTPTTILLETWQVRARAMCSASRASPASWRPSAPPTSSRSATR